MKRKIELLLAFLLLSISCAFAQKLTVKGTVLDETGQTIIGATVREKGVATNGAQTDIDGHFTLTVNQGATIVVSYVGYKTQEVKAAAQLTIKMVPDSELLDEVMVVAFGTAKKAAFTGSAAVIDSKDLKKHTTSNVANSLVGSVAGVQMKGGSGQPGASGDFSVRGVNAIGAGSTPLVIVDGAPYPQSLANIPQSDIKSITVLKDAASAALYGARGAAGVILITTNSGTNNKAVIHFDGRVGVNTRAIQEYDKITDPGEYYESFYAMLYNDALLQKDPNTGNLKYDAQSANAYANTKMLDMLKYNVYQLPDGERLIGLDGKLNPNAKLGRRFDYDGREMYLTPDDWTAEAYRPSMRQEYNMSVSGGNQQSSYYLSVGYLDDKGVIEYSGFKRFSSRLKADYKFRDWGKVIANVGYVNSTTNSNPNMDDSFGAVNLLYFTSSIAPIYPIYVREWKDGQAQIVKDRFGNDLYDFGKGYSAAQRPFGAPGNPLGANRYNKVFSNNDQLNGSVNLEVNFTDYLKFTSNNSMTMDLRRFTNYQNGLYGPAAGTNGRLTKGTEVAYRNNFSQILTYFQDFDQHHVNLMLGHEYYRMHFHNLESEKQGGFSPDILELNTFAKVKSGNSYRNDYNVEGYFASAQYDYDNRYFLSGSFRRDASSRFHKDHMWGNFWSLGAAWLISEESWMAPAKSWIDLLKLKLSLGQQGNDNIGNFAYTDQYRLSPSSDTNMSPSFRQLGNKDVTWETTTNLNFGVEFNLFKERLSGNVDIYAKKTQDLLFWISIPESAGTRGYFGNIGDVLNSGFELTLNGSIVKTKLVDWSVYGNIAHNVTKILSLPEQKIAKNGGYLDQGIWYEVGGPMYNQMNRKYAGVNEQGEALYYYDKSLAKFDKDGNIKDMNTSKPGTELSGTTTNWEKASRYAMGSGVPDLFGGFGTSLRVGPVDASLQFDYQIGGLMYDYGYAHLMSPLQDDQGAGATFHKDWVKSWSPTNKDSNLPRWKFGDKFSASGSDRFLTNASYLNFQSFTIGYTLPKFVDEISRIRVYVTGENLAFWSKRRGMDPRFSFSGNNAVGDYSPVRNISGGIEISF